MLKKVDTSGVGLSRYEDIIPDSLFEEIEKLADQIEGKKVVHVNSTAEGGGVAEILNSMVPLQNDVGLEAEWYSISEAEDKFFEITKNIHNGLQGEGRDLTESEKELYMDHNKKIAKKLERTNADYYVIHDPQPTACVQHVCLENSVCRVHIDTTSPRKQVRDFIFPFFDCYDRIIFSMEDFVASEINKEKVRIASPAINPFSTKNGDMPEQEIEKVLEENDIPQDKPFLVQVSRFDKWKNPMGLIDIFKQIREEISCRLVLIGSMASDDPEGPRLYSKIKKRSENDSDIIVISKKDDRLVNALQRKSRVVIQNSTREGFGLTVTEAMWKGNAVVGGKVGGIKHQIDHGMSGFLVESPEECAEKIVKVCKDQDLKEKLGKGAKERVSKDFLLPRLLKDYLEVFSEL